MKSRITYYISCVLFTVYIYQAFTPVNWYNFVSFIVLQVVCAGLYEVSLKRLSCHPSLFASMFLLYQINFIIQYRQNQAYQTNDNRFLVECIVDLSLLVAAFIVGYIVIKKSLYMNKRFLIAVIVVTPLAFLVSRFTNTGVRGVYNWVPIIRIMPSELCKVTLVFANIFFLSHLKRKRFSSNVYSPYMSHIWYLLYFGVLLGIAALCNEFGTLMLALLFMFCTLIFLFQMYYLWPFIMAFGTIAAAGIVMLSEKAVARLYIWIMPQKAIASSNEYIREEAVTIKKLLDNFKSAGYFGKGLGSIVIPNRTSDYVFMEVLLEMGFLMAIVVVALFIVFLINLFQYHVNHPMEYTIVYSIQLVFILSIFTTLLGNIGGFPMSGMSIPFLSSGTQAGMAYGFLLGLYLAIQERGERRE